MVAGHRIFVDLDQDRQEGTSAFEEQLHVSSKPVAATASSSKPNQETIFFDGGAHYGDLLANLLLGFTLVWMPLTLAAVFRAFYLRYRFTNLRVTVISGLTGQERSDFSYKVVKDVQVVPRFIGEWGDVIITLKDGTKVDIRNGMLVQVRIINREMTYMRYFLESLSILN